MMSASNGDGGSVIDWKEKLSKSRERDSIVDIKEILKSIVEDLKQISHTIEIFSIKLDSLVSSIKWLVALVIIQAVFFLVLVGFIVFKNSNAKFDLSQSGVSFETKVSRD